MGVSARHGFNTGTSSRSQGNIFNLNNFVGAYPGFEELRTKYIPARPSTFGQECPTYMEALE